MKKKDEKRDVKKGKEKLLVAATDLNVTVTAELPAQIRGYGHVKERALVKVREQAAALRERLTARAIPVVQLCQPAV